MKRLICLLLAALMILSFCACSTKKEEQKKTDETKVTEKTQTQAQVKPESNEIADPDGIGNENGTEIGTLPIIFEDDKPDDGTEGENAPGGDSSQSTPPISSSSGQNILGGDTVVETPIIPFN